MKSLVVCALIAIVVALLWQSGSVATAQSPLPAWSPPALPPRPLPPTRTLPQECGGPGWQRLADWMGLYELWTDGRGYCVGARVG